MPMPDKVYDIEEVRSDLLRIIDEHPTEHGFISRRPDLDDECSEKCVYFYNDEPICIVGRWLALHNLQYDQQVVSIVHGNDIWPGPMGRLFSFLTPAAQDLLRCAQELQDGRDAVTHDKPSFRRLRDKVADMDPGHPNSGRF